ncbi:Cytochrome b561 [Tepidimonas fonticaldi]|uniref:Cytochrome b561 n=2 Tax=Tepidimonas fonticaldi TaxID=1101373 RepID=A0A554XJR0_9BURK|nr:Cytochrome b561 [Tepidimonas fonticaldi]
MGEGPAPTLPPMSSPLSTPAQTYHPVAVGLHWLLAVALIGLLVMGVVMTGLPFSPLRLKLYNWHKWIAIAVLALSVLRWLWRLTHRPPPLPAAMAGAMPAWQRAAHRAVHAGLYGLFFAVPLLGWAYSSAAGFPVVWLGVLPLPDFVPVDPALAQALKPWHRWSAYALAALIALHVAGALKHALVDRDGLLGRMA